MTLSKKVSSAAINAAMKHAGIYDLDSWGIDQEIKSLFKNSEYYGKPTVRIANEAEFSAYPDQCFWEEHNINSEWVFYLIGTLRVDVSVDWGEGRSLTSTVELNSVTYPLGTDTYEFMREHVPTQPIDGIAPKPMPGAEYRVYVYYYPEDSERLPALQNSESHVIGTVDTKLHYGEEGANKNIELIKKSIASINNVPLENVYAELMAI